MRALTVGNMYPPHHHGGYEQVWQSAVRGLRAHGHDVRVLTTDFRLDTADPDDAGVHRELRWWWRDHAYPRIPWRERLEVERHNAAVFDRHVEELRPDVVSWWSMGGMSLSLIERARRQGLRAVAFVHDDWLDYGPRVDAWLRPFLGRPRLAAFAERRTGIPAQVDLDSAARCLFVSDATRRRAEAAGRHVRDWGIAHSGIADALVDPRPAAEWSWRLLYVGRIDPRKGIDTAVAALAKLPDEATLTVVGEGDPAAEAALRADADRLGVAERIRFEGFRSKPELPAAYEACDVVVFPVRWEEPWGLVPLEGMAAGRPVVATGRGGSGEYLRDGENALLFQAGDAAGLAEAVRRLAADPALRERLRAPGLATARRHTESVFNRAVRKELEAAAA